MLLNNLVLSMFKIITLMVIAYISFGCATSKPYLAQNDVTLDPASDYGLVIMSVNLTAAPKGFKYLITSDNDEKSYRVPAYGTFEELTPMLQSDFEEVTAKLVVLKLGAGKYKFVEWYTSFSNQYGTYESRSEQGFPVYFDVLANNATYIGEIYQINKHSGFSIIDSKVYVRDSSERDLSLFLKQYPNIKKEQIIEKLVYKDNPEK